MVSFVESSLERFLVELEAGSGLVSLREDRELLPGGEGGGEGKDGSSRLGIELSSCTKMQTCVRLQM